MPLSLLDISNSLKNSKVCLKVPELDGGHVVEVNGHPVSSSGGYCVVYKYQLANGKYKALRIWHKDLSLLPDLPEVAEKVSDELARLKSNYFVEYKYYEKAILVAGQFYPAVVMDWCDGEDLKDYISSNVNDTAKMKNLAQQFRKMVKFFHENDVSHGDLQHGNIRIRPDGTICVLDYDSMYVPALKGKLEYIKGLPSFQHPTARDNNDYLSPKVDFFSESVIYLALMLLIKDPSLWTNEVKCCDDILLFDNNDLLNINNTKSRIFKYRNEASNSIVLLVRSLQSFMKQDSIDNLSPLEKVIDPYIHGNPGLSKTTSPKQPPKTQISTVNVADVIGKLKK